MRSTIEGTTPTGVRAEPTPTGQAARVATATVRNDRDRQAGAGRGPLATIILTAVTAVVIAAVAYLANQPATTLDAVTAVTLTGPAGAEPPTVGRSAPDFTATTVDGTPVRLSDLRGQPVWLTFGASWCQPCRAENPDIQAAYEQLRLKGGTVLAVFISEDAPAVADYATRVGLTYPKVADPDTRIASLYRILGIPSHYFIDRDGVLRGMRIGSLDPAGIEAALAEIAR